MTENRATWASEQQSKTVPWEHVEMDQDACNFPLRKKEDETNISSFRFDDNPLLCHQINWSSRILPERSQVFPSFALS